MLYAEPITLIMHFRIKVFASSRAHWRSSSPLGIFIIRTRPLTHARLICNLSRPSRLEERMVLCCSSLHAAFIAVMYAVHLAKNSGKHAFVQYC